MHSLYQEAHLQLKLRMRREQRVFDQIKKDKLGSLSKTDSKYIG